MERRKFKRRKPADGEPRNRALDDIEPGASVPVPDRAKRVFARSRSVGDDFAADLDGPMEPLVPRKRRKPDPADQMPEPAPAPLAPDDLIERVQDATHSAEPAPRRRKQVVVAPKKRAVAAPAADPAAEADADRIRALKEKKARLLAEKKRRAEQLRAEEAARQRAAAEDSARQTGLQDALRREANERKESLRAERERLAAAKAARAEAARKKAEAEEAARLQRERAEAEAQRAREDAERAKQEARLKRQRDEFEAQLAREEEARRVRAEAAQRAQDEEARRAQEAEDEALRAAQDKAERRRAALELRAAERAEEARLQKEMAARRKRAEDEARLLAEEEALDDWDDDFEDHDLDVDEADVDVDDDDYEPEPPAAAAAPRRRGAAPVTEPPQPRPSRRAPKPASEAGAAWDTLRPFPVDDRLLERNRVITAAREDLAHTAFDVLRTRLLQGLRQNGWSRVAITSPSKDCGKTFTAANLALSLSRQENCRTILLDFDMRRPSLARVFGIENCGTLGDMLRGDVAPEDHLRVMGKNTLDVGRNVAFGFNDKVEPYASELLHEAGTAEVLDDMQRRFNADVVLFDMPPALYHDDVMAARNLFDGVLLVIGGGITKASEVKDVERRLGADTPFLGSILNFSEGPGITKYSY
ncbi:hypothetical protein VK792_08400 [Mesobacterium sp. TK19101]|uniref:Uncharacterized protein n=1 Tax=Mesobacterium hydrothermale TaxID=3111907 RepID=A0ABU6HFR3_9RHOB|nr:hypothetical protein [Mesobacterium sp. TK19101]MEC3861302.1 hypothetical protein [Mesobacterium sp. TK19101]